MIHQCQKVKAFFPSPKFWLPHCVLRGVFALLKHGKNSTMFKCSHREQKELTLNFHIWQFFYPFEAFFICVKSLQGEITNCFSGIWTYIKISYFVSQESSIHDSLHSICKIGWDKYWLNLEVGRVQRTGKEM